MAKNDPSEIPATVDDIAVILQVFEIKFAKLIERLDVINKHLKISNDDGYDADLYRLHNLHNGNNDPDAT